MPSWAGHMDNQSGYRSQDEELYLRFNNFDVVGLGSFTTYTQPKRQVRMFKRRLVNGHVTTVATYYLQSTFNAATGRYAHGWRTGIGASSVIAFSNDGHPINNALDWITMSPSWLPVADYGQGSIAYTLQFRVRNNLDTGWTDWSELTPIYAFTGSSYVRANHQSFRPRLEVKNQIGQEITESNPIATHDNIRFNWFTSGGFPYQRVALKRIVNLGEPQGTLVTYYNGTNFSDPDAWISFWQGTPPAGFEQVGHTSWHNVQGEEYQGRYEWQVALQRDWDFQWTSFSPIVFFDTEPPEGNTPAPRIQWVNPGQIPATAHYAEATAPLRLQWNPIYDSDGEPISFDRVRVKMFTFSANTPYFSVHLGNQNSVQYLSVAGNPVRWIQQNTWIPNDGGTEVVLTPRFGEGWMKQNFDQTDVNRYYGVTVSVRPAGGNDNSWSPESTLAYVWAVHSSDPPAPALSSPSSGELYDPEEEVRFTVEIPFRHHGRAISIRRRISQSTDSFTYLSLNPDFSVVSWTENFSASHAISSLSNNIGRIISSDIQGDNTTGTGTIYISVGTNSGWQPYGTTYYYSAAYYDVSSASWSDFGPERAITTTATRPGPATITSPEYDAELDVNNSITLRWSNPLVNGSEITHDRVRVSRSAVTGEGISVFQYWDGQNWRNNSPSVEAGNSEYSIATSAKQLTISGGSWFGIGSITTSGYYIFYEVQVRRSSDDVWSQWSGITGTPTRILAVVSGLQGYRITQTGRTQQLWNEDTSHIPKYITHDQEARIDWVNSSATNMQRLAIIRSVSGQLHYALISGSNVTWHTFTSYSNVFMDNASFTPTSTNHLDIPSGFQQANQRTTYYLYYRSGSSNWSKRSTRLILDTHPQAHPEPTWRTGHPTNHSRHQSLRLRWNDPSVDFDEVELRALLTFNDPQLPAQNRWLRVADPRNLWDLGQVQFDHEINSLVLDADWALPNIANVRFYLTYFDSTGHASNESGALLVSANDNRPAAPRWVSPAADNGTSSHSSTTPLTLRFVAPSRFDRIQLFRIRGEGEGSIQEHLASLSSDPVTASWTVSGASILFASTAQPNSGTEWSGTIQLPAGWALPGGHWDYYITYKNSTSTSLFKFSERSGPIRINAESVELPTLTNITAHDGAQLLFSYLENGVTVFGAVKEDGTRLHITPEQREHIHSVIGENDDLPLVRDDRIYYLSSSGIAWKNLNNGSSGVVIGSPYFSGSRYVVRDFVFTADGAYVYVAYESTFSGNAQVYRIYRYNLPNFDNDHYVGFMDRPAVGFHMVASQQWLFMYHLSSGVRYTYEIRVEDGTGRDLDELREQSATHALKYIGVYPNNVVDWIDYNPSTAYLRRKSAGTNTISTVLANDPYPSLAENHQYYAVSQSYLWQVKRQAPSLFKRTSTSNTSNNYTPVNSVYEISRVQFSPISGAATSTPGEDTTPVAVPEVFLNTGMLMYAYTVNDSDNNLVVRRGAIDHDGEAITLSPIVRSTLNSLGTTLPNIIYGDIAYVATRSRIVPTNLSTGEIGQPVAHADNVFAGVTASAENTYAYALEMKIVSSEPETAKIVRWKLPSFDQKQTVLDLANWSYYPYDVLRYIDRIAIYASDSYIFIEAGSHWNRSMFKIERDEIGSTNPSDHELYVHDSLGIGISSYLLKGISDNNQNAQYYMGRNASWLRREDADNEAQFTEAISTEVIRNQPFGYAGDPKITEWHIWVHHRAQRSINQYSRLGTLSFTREVVPSGGNLVDIAWYQPPNWELGEAAPETSNHPAPTWNEPPENETDVNKEYDLPLPIRWSNNITTAGVTQTHVQFRRFDLLGEFPPHYLIRVNENETIWRMLAQNEEVPWVAWTTQAMTMQSEWQPRNTVRQWEFRYLASDGEPSEWSSFKIFRTTGAETTTFNFNKGYVATQIGSEGSGATYGVFDFEGAFTSYTTNRNTHPLLTNPLDYSIDKFTYGGLTGSKYIYQLYGNHVIGYPEPFNTNRTRVKRIEIIDGNINQSLTEAPSIYQAPSDIHAVLAIARNGDKAYTLEFDTVNDLMYIRQFDLPSFTASNVGSRSDNIVYRGPFFTPEDWYQWYQLSVSDTYAYVVKAREDGGFASYRVDINGTDTSLQTYQLGALGEGYTNISPIEMPDGTWRVYMLSIHNGRLVYLPELAHHTLIPIDVASGTFTAMKVTKWHVWAYESFFKRLYQFNLDGSNRVTVHQGDGNDTVRYFDVFYPDDWLHVDEALPVLYGLDQMYVFYTHGIEHGDNFIGVIDYEGDKYRLTDNHGSLAFNTDEIVRFPAFEYNGELFFHSFSGVNAVSAIDLSTDRAALNFVTDSRYPNDRVETNGTVTRTTSLYLMVRHDHENSPYMYGLEAEGGPYNATLRIKRYRLPLFDEILTLGTITNANPTNYRTMFANENYVYLSDYASGLTTHIQRVSTSGTGELENWYTFPGYRSASLLGATNSHVYIRTTGAAGGGFGEVVRINTFGSPNPEVVMRTVGQPGNYPVLLINSRIHITPWYIWQIDTRSNDIHRYDIDGTNEVVYSPIATNDNLRFSTVLWPHDWEFGEVQIGGTTNIQPTTIRELPEGSSTFKWEPPLSTSLDWTIGLRAVLLAPDMTILEDITDALIEEECSVQYDVSRRIRTTAVLTVNRDIDWFNHKVKLTMTVLDNESNTMWHDHLGVFVVETIDKSLDENDEHIVCQAFDLFAVMDSPIGFQYIVPENTPYPTMIRQLFDDMASWYGNQQAQPVNDYDPPAGVQYSVSAGSSEHVPMLIGEKVWPASQSYTWLSLLEVMCREAGYRKPWITRDGVVTVDESRDFSVNIELPTGDYAVIDPEIEFTTDLWGQPNQWVFVAENSFVDVPLPSGDNTTQSFVRTNNIEESPGAYRNRGRRLLRSMLSFPATARNQEQLDDTFERQARRMMEEDIQGGERIKFNMAPNPSLWHGDVMRLPFVIEGKWMVQKWNLSFDGSSMSVEAVRVIEDWEGLS